VFSEYDQSTEFLGQSLSHEASVVVEAPDIALIAGVKENGPVYGIPVLSIHNIPHIKGRRRTTVVIVI
jgi:hypothetical protein